MKYFTVLTLVLLLRSSRSSRTDAGDPCNELASGRFPHPDYCQAYYDCGETGGGDPGLEPHMFECKYPQLYNEGLRICDDFDMVSCGDRQEFVNGCDYLKNQCNGPHCRPCWLEFQDCSGKPDGLAPSFRPRHYIICKSQRFMGEEMCPPDASGVPMLFDVKSNTCMKKENSA